MSGDWTISVMLLQPPPAALWAREVTSNSSDGGLTQELDPSLTGQVPASWLFGLVPSAPVRPPGSCPQYSEEEFHPAGRSVP